MICVYFFDVFVMCVFMWFGGRVFYLVFDFVCVLCVFLCVVYEFVCCEFFCTVCILFFGMFVSGC